MTTFEEVINIRVNDEQVVSATNNLKTLKSTINTINSQSVKIKGADSLKGIVREYKNLFNSLGKQNNLGGIRSAIREMNRLYTMMSKNNSLNIKEGNLQSVISSVEKLTGEIQELNSIAKGIDLSKLSKGGESANKTNSDVEKLNSSLKETQSLSNITIKINGGNVNSTTSSVRQSAVRATGHNHTGNYFGFYADDSPLYQYGSALKQTTRRMQMASEKINLIGANLATFAAYAGVHEMTDILIETPAKAEVQKYLMSEMQGDAVTHDVKNVLGHGEDYEATLYTLLDKTTDRLPISMQNVVQPLYAWNSATQSTEEDLAYAIPSMANFGAQVINMTGSEERAQTAMEKLSYAFNGQFHAVDQFGISEYSLEKVGFKKEWLGQKEHIRDFFDAVDELTGDATKSMNNFNGLKALVSKDFARSGKNVWNNFLGPLATGGLRAFHETDSALGGIPTTVMAVGSAGLSLATTLTMLVGSAGTAVGAFSEAFASFRVMRKNGGGLKEFFRVFSASSFNELNRYGYGGNYGRLAQNGGYLYPYMPVGGGGGGASPNKPAKGTGKNKQGTQEKKSQKKYKDKSYKAGRYNSMDSRVNRKSSRRIQKGLLLNEKVASGNVIPTYPDKQKPIRGTNRFSRRLNGWSDSLRKGGGSFRYLTKSANKVTSSFASLGGGLSSFLFSWKGLALGLIGVALASQWYSNAVQKNAKVAEADARLHTALNQAKQNAVTQIGDYFKAQGWTKHGGEEGTYEGLILALDKATDFVYSLPFVDKQDKYYTHALNPEEDRDLPEKKKHIRDVDWQRWLAEPAAQVADVTGLGWISRLVSGKSIPQVLDEKAEAKREKIRDTNYSGERLAKTMEQYNKKQTERAKEKKNESDVIHAKDKAKSMETVSYKNLTRTEADDLRHHGTIRQKTTADLWSDIEKTKANIDSKLPVSGQKNFQFDNRLLSVLSAPLSFLANLPTASATKVNGVDAEQLALQKATQSNIQTSTGFSNIYNNMSSSIETQAPALANQFALSYSQSLATADFSMAGNTVSTQMNSAIQESFATTPIDLTGFFSNITSQLSMHSAEFNTAGNDGGNQYQTGFGTGIGGTSGIASAEAGEVLSALDISKEAYAKGQAAGNAFQAGFKSSGGDDIQSPGKAARLARDETNYLLGFMQGSISPIYNTARQMGSSMATGFARDGSLAYTGTSFSAVKKENTAGYIMSSGDSTKTYHLTQNVNIEKVDSKERAKEIAEYTVKMMKWNNETAGRTTEV